MQNTRLNNLVEDGIALILNWAKNPWRRLSLTIIGLLFGIFLGTAIPTTSGQVAAWDLSGAAVILLVTELISRITYGRPTGDRRSSLLWQTLNATKIGWVYGLFVEAFKLGS